MWIKNYENHPNKQQQQNNMQFYSNMNSHINYYNRSNSLNNSSNHNLPLRYVTQSGQTQQTQQANFLQNFNNPQTSRNSSYNMQQNLNVPSVNISYNANNKQMEMNNIYSSLFNESSTDKFTSHYTEARPAKQSHFTRTLQFNNDDLPELNVSDLSKHLLNNVRTNNNNTNCSQNEITKSVNYPQNEMSNNTNHLGNSIPLSSSTYNQNHFLSSSLPSFSSSFSQSPYNANEEPLKKRSKTESEIIEDDFLPEGFDEFISDNGMDEKPIGKLHEYLMSDTEYSSTLSPSLSVLSAESANTPTNTELIPSMQQVKLQSPTFTTRKQEVESMHQEHDKSMPQEHVKSMPQENVESMPQEHDQTNLIVKTEEKNPKKSLIEKKKKVKNKIENMTDIQEEIEPSVTIQTKNLNNINTTSERTLKVKKQVRRKSCVNVKSERVASQRQRSAFSVSDVDKIKSTTVDRETEMAKLYYKDKEFYNVRKYLRKLSNPEASETNKSENIACKQKCGTLFLSLLKTPTCENWILDSVKASKNDKDINLENMTKRKIKIYNDVSTEEIHNYCDDSGIEPFIYQAGRTIDDRHKPSKTLLDLLKEKDTTAI